MIHYRLNPYISFIESRLFPESIQLAVFHRLSGLIITTSERARAVLQAAKSGNQISLGEAELQMLGDLGSEIQVLIQNQFLIPEDHEPLAIFRDQYVVRPIQNPALLYRSETGKWISVRTSMDHTIYSRKRGEMPTVIEETLSPLVADILLLADGSKTLLQIFSATRESSGLTLLEDTEFRSAIDFLTSQDRQLIKFTSQHGDLGDPYKPVNIVPRNLYHADRWHDRPLLLKEEKLTEFHLHGIEDAVWEFDQIEPTVNHCFRFPHEALGGLDYGSRFCLSTLKPDVLPLLDHQREFNVLEVGGGTGSFARSFIEQINRLSNAQANELHINYHILDLSNVLIQSQREILSELFSEDRHFHQDATQFDIPDRKFDLIVSNEVIADFPVSSVQRNTNGTWEGDGAQYLKQYDLASVGAPDTFLINVGAFRFIERAWKHLTPGGTLIVTEYGSEHLYPIRSVHLNHDEFSIHFGYLAACAVKIGFQSRLLKLRDFLEVDDEILVLNGREEHLLCLNHVFNRFGLNLPYAVISKSDFERQCQTLAERLTLSGYSFSPLRMGYHFGPNLRDFFVLIMNKPLN